MKTKTKIGDVFSVKIDENSKRYFQYIIDDRTQLGSNVIRVFKRVYGINDNFSIIDIINDEIDFYTHVFVKLGIKMGIWEKLGNNSNIGSIDQIIFKGTNDYGRKLGEAPLKTSDKWYVWRINDPSFIQVGKLEGDNLKAYNGLVINPFGIIELLKGNKYPPYYPE